MDAVRLKQVDMDYRNHLQAFLNFSVKAEKKAGKNKSKPVYSRFKKFYDYEKEIAKITKKGNESGIASSMSRFLRKGE